MIDIISNNIIMTLNIDYECCLQMNYMDINYILQQNISKNTKEHILCNIPVPGEENEIKKK